MPGVKKNSLFRSQGLLKRSAVVAAATAGLAVAIPATPAAAVSRVDCHFPAVIDEYARVESRGLPTCFANAGGMAVSIVNVSQFHSGNNKVTFFYTIEGSGYANALTLEKWQDHTLTFGASAHLNEVFIW
ncbi:beta/gamma crystallin domain-containing protein [Streptomyces sp. B3I8]|jgi:hypothetical protein|uniref:beta/gamma crystallin domain-containing protein n=1 Tax=Streptomyces sp. B3I8 TaxID=3042303 RepID=UPI002784BE84|nr:beta/gamma crystallin domain-containing protein [Streptomyces sp. B3I8]MDQ0788978.1 hypothetical protein [Streptomyces sp. B3I8]